MTIYKQILESAKPAGAFGKAEQVVALNFVLGLVDTEEAKKELAGEEEPHRCETCKHDDEETVGDTCIVCILVNDKWEPKEEEKK